MRKNIVAGNWKMNKTLQEGIALAKELNEMLANEKPNCDVIICTPFIHLASVTPLVDPAKIDRFDAFCRRERCPYAVIGRITEEKTLKLVRPGETPAVDMPMEVLLGKAPRVHRVAEHEEKSFAPFTEEGLTIEKAALDVLRHPAVASKSFLITIGDRSVGGLVSRDPMVGPWQVPVADCARL